MKSTYFAPHQNGNEALKKVPTDRIVAEEWPLLVQYWKEEKDIAWRNTNNSIKRKFPHRTGRKPFTALVDEIKATGKGADNLEIWMSSRTNGRGGDDEMTDHILAYLNNELNKIPVDKRTPAAHEALYRRALGGKRNRKTTVDSATSSAYP
ncbi:uncharacterized protein LOC127239427 [Andrographis paniculata]|uniref:uncharacterized protein LOC127239427 n=1 Tax=Andrographis paniculata TaxID=175694 RepID=UPI0021E985DB|nr:uncharacterized protein LOC127239427 [Andrographis paniculata]